MFKSEAHKRRMGELVDKGLVTPEKYAEMEKATGDKKLPERLTPKKQVQSVEDIEAEYQRRFGK